MLSKSVSFFALGALLVAGPTSIFAEGAASASSATSSASASAPAVKPAAPKAPALNSFEKAIVEQTNAERARSGLPALKVDQRLMDSARAHCKWMCRAGQLQHSNQAVGENIALGQMSTDEAMTSWMNSPGHRANILGGYTRIGVAAYTAADGRPYWCQQFLR